MRKKTIFSLLLAVLLFSYSGMAENSSPTSSNANPASSVSDSKSSTSGIPDFKNSGVIKIGAIYNLTGEQAPLDIPSANGAKLAVKKINESGGVLGKKIELLLNDGKTDLKNIRSIAESLSSKNEISAMIGFSDTDQVMAAAPIAAKSGISFTTSGATSPKLPAMVPEWLFLACFGDNVQAAAGAEFAVKNLSSKAAYLLIQSDMDYTMLLAKYFKESYINSGGKIISEDSFKSSDKDFSSQINKLKNSANQPDILYIAAGPDKIGEIIKQFRNANFNQPVIGGDSYDSPLLVQTAGSAAKNVYFTTHCLIDAESASLQIKNFVKEYKENFNNEMPNAFAALGFDTVNLIVNAVKTANSAEPESVRDALRKTQNLAGITGKITYQSGNPVPQKSVTVIKIENGKFISVAEIIPQKFPQP